MYQTFTNDPVILDLVAKYNAAVEATNQAQRALDGLPVGSEEWTEAMDQSLLKEQELGIIQTRLCSAFVWGLELSTKDTP